MLAGGQSLVPLLNFRLLRPAVLVDVNRVAGLDRIDGARVGATVRQNDFTGVPLAAQALPSVGHFVTRNRGTVGGSIAHADPSAELPLCLLVLGGSVVTTRREIAADDFFRSHFTTALEPDELVVETVWPEGGSVAFEEIAQRHGDFALSLAACSVRRRARHGGRGAGRRRRGDRPADAARARARGRGRRPERPRARPVRRRPRRSTRPETCTPLPRTSATSPACSSSASSRRRSRDRGDRERHASPRRGRAAAPARATSSATRSASPARTSAASTASAARAPCGSTARRSGAACSSPSRPTGSRSRPWKGSSGARCTRRSAATTRCSAGSAPRGS